MPDDNRYSDDEKSSRRGGEFKVPPRTWIVWILIFAGIVLLVLFRDRMDTPGKEISQYDFLKLVKSNQIAHATINYNPQTPLNEIKGEYLKQEGDQVKKVPSQFTYCLPQTIKVGRLANPQSLWIGQGMACNES